MTDRYVAFTVILDRETREDDARPILDAIAMIRGVREVVPVVEDPRQLFIHGGVKREIIAKLMELLR